MAPASRVAQLKEALSDPEFYVELTPRGEKRVYYIRRKAKEALERLGETVDVVTEEPVRRERR